MNSFWLSLLVMAIKAMAGAVVWEDVQAAVISVANGDISGEEKRAIVLCQLKRAFQNVPTSLLNLAIEIAVTKAAPR